MPKRKRDQVCKTAMDTQSVVFDRDDWSRAAARAWLKKNGFKYTKVDSSKRFLRYRQEDPKGHCKRGSFRMKDLGKGIKLNLCCRKK